MRRLVLVALVLSTFVLLTSQSSAFAEKRGVNVEASERQNVRKAIDFGTYYALIIGNDKYTDLPSLKTAVSDASEVSRMLLGRYGFQEVKLLTNATREQIIGALDELRATVTSKDNVLIYYAGHGILDEASDRGYWLPIDASRTNRIHWISTVDITDTLKAMSAKHVLVVADSCYSGTLTRSASVKLKVGQLSDTYLARLAAKRSRTALMSGGLEPVEDAGGGNHSVFAKAFLTILEENGDVLDGQTLFAQLRPRVVVNAHQTPEYADVRFAGHDGGDFLFVPYGPRSKDVSAASQGSDSNSEEMTRMRTELEALKAQMRKPAEQPKTLEVAKAPSYEAPRTINKEITGKDGAPMVLVPAGEFMYGDGNQRLAMPAFYMDKYEVRTKLYSQFLQATNHSQPRDWSEQLTLIASGDRPVVHVAWDDADRYCRHFGKRLPTNQEWEKAARGTDGRKYPWGNEEPTSRHALFATRWEGYGTLAVVGSHESGASPYGILDMAGNVSEWTSSGDEKGDKIIRGGSWSTPSDYLLTTKGFGIPPIRKGVGVGFRCAQDAK